MQDPESEARASLFRSLLIYSALLGIAALALYYIISAGPRGAGYVTLSIVAVVALLLASQVFQHYRDLRSPLVESEGVIQRKWSRADLIIFLHSYYLSVDRAVFRVRSEDYAMVDEAMYVKVVHFPNTRNVVSIHEIRRPPPDPSTQI